LKSKRKRQANNFVRKVRAESELNAYTRALGYVMGRDRDQAIRLLRERIAYSRQELQHAAESHNGRPDEAAPRPVLDTSARAVEPSGGGAKAERD
jgi:hypothetical protein